MEIKDKIIISKDFSDLPYGRDKFEGDFNGETFLIKFLYPKFLNAVKSSYKLEIDFNGIYGYPSSFISGSFGNLSYWLSETLGKEKAKELIYKHISFKSEDNPMRATQVLQEIENPKVK